MTARNVCGAVLGQQKGVGPGLFISCQNERPCPVHPRSVDDLLTEEARAVLLADLAEIRASHSPGREAPQGPSADGTVG